MQAQTLVFYDGVCPFCIGWVRFIIDRDGADRFRFASLQSDWAQRFFEKEGFEIPKQPALLVYDGGYFHLASEAAIVIAGHLPGVWRLLRHVSKLPFAWRNRGYHWLAARRYSIAKKRESCWLPDPAYRHKFLDQQ